MNLDLERKLRHLRLSGFVAAMPVRNQEAINNHLAYVEFLELLVEDELARRRELLFQRRLKQAQLPQVKTLDGFDWNFNHKLPKALILDLATLRFIPERGGALILGAAGLGKSHICISIAVRAIEAVGGVRSCGTWFLGPRSGLGQAGGSLAGTRNTIEAGGGQG